MYDMGSFQWVVYSLSFEVYQATNVVEVTSVSILLLSYFQSISTAVKLEDFKAACVLLLLCFFSNIHFFEDSNKYSSLFINLLLQRFISFID